MAKTKEELDALKSEVDTINEKLGKLSDEEIKYVSGGDGQKEGENLWLDTIKGQENKRGSMLEAHGNHERKRDVWLEIHGPNHKKA